MFKKRALAELGFYDAPIDTTKPGALFQAISRYAEARGASELITRDQVKISLVSCTICHKTEPPRSVNRIRGPRSLFITGKYPIQGAGKPCKKRRSLHLGLRGGLAGERRPLRDRDHRLSYPELVDAADRLAAHLAGHGIRPGNRVAVWLPSRVETAIALLACSRNGYIVALGLFL